MKRSGLEDNKSPSSSTGSVGGRPSEEQRLRIRKGARRASSGGIHIDCPLIIGPWSWVREVGKAKENLIKDWGQYLMSELAGQT
ncbi:hypothetical protein ACOSQ2_031874 [Xanthoceras sorbifolium]